MKKGISVITSVALASVLAMSMVGCASDAANESGENQATEASENATFDSDIKSEETVNTAASLLSEKVDWEVPTTLESWTIYTTNGQEANPIYQGYVWSGDGKHMAYVAWNPKTKAILGMDIDRDNVVPYTDELMNVL